MYMMGSFLFGIVFMATEPVTGCHTDKGRWYYGLIVGSLTVIIRSINPAYPEGVMLSILFATTRSPTANPSPPAVTVAVAAKPAVTATVQVTVLPCWFKRR